LGVERAALNRFGLRRGPRNGAAAIVGVTVMVGPARRLVLGNCLGLLIGSGCGDAGYVHVFLYLFDFGSLHLIYRTTKYLLKELIND
jgi:hypothetical protein